jgi:hypothetical protein
MLLSQGQAVPVSPRDNFAAHFTALTPLVDGILQSLVDNPANLMALQVCVEHASAHLEMALTAGADKASLQEPTDLIKAWTDALTQLTEHETMAAAAQQPAQVDPAVEQPAPQI